MSTQGAGTITFQGIGSGTDFGAMVDELRKVEEFHINSLEEWKTDWELRIEGFKMLTELMGELETKTQSLSNIYDIITLGGQSSDETSVSVTPTSSASPGSYTINVEQVATASIWATKTENAFVKESDGKFDTLIPTGTGPETFSYTMGTKTINVEVNDEMTIEDLVSRINNDSHNPGVKASLVSTGSGYAFQLQSTQTGEANNITVNSSINGLNSSSDFNKVDGKDAIFYMNGFEDQKLTSASNSVTGVIEGATINLMNVTDGSATLTITEDTSEVIEKVTEWVDCVNQLRELIDLLTAVDSDAVAGDPNETVTQEEADIGSILTGNYGVQLLESRLNSIASSPAYGFESTHEKSYTYASDDYKILNYPSSIADGYYDLNYSTDAEGEVTSISFGGDNMIEDSTRKGVYIIEDLHSPFHGMEITLDNLKTEQNYNEEIYIKDGAQLKPDFNIDKIPGTLSAGTHEVVYQTDANGQLVPDTVYIGNAKAVEDSAYPGIYTVTDSESLYYGFTFDFNETESPPNRTIHQNIVVANGDVTSYSIMSELGIETNTEEGSASYGLLEIDNVALMEAIEANPRAVAELLAGNSVSSTSENFIYHSKTSNVEAGLYDVQYVTDESGKITSVLVDGAEASVSDLYPNRYTVSDPTSPAYGLSIEFSIATLEPNRTYTGDTISVKQGKALELNTFFENEIRDVPGQEGNGAIPILISNYEDVVENIDKKIAQEEERLDLWESRQRARYARLDASLAVMSALLESNASALAAANNNSAD